MAASASEDPRLRQEKRLRSENRIKREKTAILLDLRQQNFIPVSLHLPTIRYEDHTIPIPPSMRHFSRYARLFWQDSRSSA